MVPDLLEARNNYERVLKERDELLAAVKRMHATHAWGECIGPGYGCDLCDIAEAVLAKFEGAGAPLNPHQP